MPNLTKQSVLNHLKKKSNGKVKKYWRLDSLLDDGNKEYEFIFFKGDRYSAVTKSYKYLLRKGTDMFRIFDFHYHAYGEKYSQYDTFKESVDEYIDGFFDGDTQWLSEVSKPIVL